MVPPHHFETRQSVELRTHRSTLLCVVSYSIGLGHLIPQSQTLATPFVCSLFGPVSSLYREGGGDLGLMVGIVSEISFCHPSSLRLAPSVIGTLGTKYFGCRSSHVEADFVSKY